MHSSSHVHSLHDRFIHVTCTHVWPYLTVPHLPPCWQVSPACPADAQAPATITPPQPTLAGAPPEVPPQDAAARTAQTHFDQELDTIITALQTAATPGAGASTGHSDASEAGAGDVGGARRAGSASDGGVKSTDGVGIQVSVWGAIVRVPRHRCESVLEQLTALSHAWSSSTGSESVGDTAHLVEYVKDVVEWSAD